MSGERLKNHARTVNANSNGSYGFEAAQLTVLMDIRDELQKLNAVFSCHNFQQIPGVLRGIRRNTAKPKRRKS